MDLEKSIIAQIVDREELRKAWDLGLRADHIVDPINRGIFSFIAQYWQNSHLESAPTREAVIYEFPRFVFPEEVEETTDWLVEKLKIRHVRNALQESMLAASDMAGRPEGVLEAVRKINIDSWEALKLATPRIGRTDFSQDIEQRRERYELRSRFEGRVAGVPLGLEEVDDHTFGILPGELALIVGYAKSGKSMALIHAALAARRAGYTPYFATLELSVSDIEERMDAHISGLPYEAIQKGRLAVEEGLALRATQDEFAGYGSLFIEKLPRGERTVQYIVNRAWDLGANFLIIDQLSFLESESKNREQHLRVADIVADLKSEISQDESHAMPTLLAAQLNRESQKQGKGSRARLDQIALSAAVEQTVDIAYSISQTSEMRANRSMLLDIMGFRRGAPKGWLLAWDLDRRTHISVRQEMEQE